MKIGVFGVLQGLEKSIKMHGHVQGKEVIGSTEHMQLCVSHLESLTGYDVVLAHPYEVNGDEPGLDRIRQLAIEHPSVQIYVMVNGKHWRETTIGVQQNVHYGINSFFAEVLGLKLE